MACKHSPGSTGFSFHAVDCFFFCAEAFSFDVISLVCLFSLLLLVLLRSLSKKSFPRSMSQNFIKQGKGIRNDECGGAF